MSEEKEKINALKAISAWRQLKALSLLNNEETLSIEKKIMALYGKYLGPLRNHTKI